jgi:hypothetical protein
MPTLDQQAQVFFEAGRFKAQRSQAGFFDFVRATDRGPKERVLLWIDNEIRPPSDKLSAAERASRDAKEGALLQGFEREMRAAPGAVGYFLIGRSQGLSQNFTKRAAALLGASGGIRVPIQLFDTAYRSKSADGSESAIYRGFRGLARPGTQFRRVAQPFYLRTGVGLDELKPVKGVLVEHLEAAL